MLQSVLTHSAIVLTVTIKPGTHYLVTWTDVMLCVHLGCKRRINIEFCGIDYHFCHCLRHVISCEALVGWRASTPLTFLLLHPFRDTWPTCRGALQTLLPVSRNGGNAYWKRCQRTFLYGIKSPDYRDQHMRANAWEEIGNELKIKHKFYVFSCMCRFIAVFI